MNAVRILIISSCVKTKEGSIMYTCIQKFGTQ